MPRYLVQRTFSVGLKVPVAGVVVAAALVVGFTGVASAASYKTGTYKAGSAKADGVTLTIRSGSFSLSRISFRETCTSANDSFTERFTFLKGTAAKLDGKIDKDARLSGSYKGQGGSVTVTGTVKGSTATVKGTESGKYRPPTSTAVYTCRGSKTFDAKRVS
jgi:hypothetical protein